MAFIGKVVAPADVIFLLKVFFSDVRAIENTSSPFISHCKSYGLCTVKIFKLYALTHKEVFRLATKKINRFIIRNICKKLI